MNHYKLLAISQMRKRPKIFYVTAFLCLCSITAFYYFVLVRDVELDALALYPNDAKVSKEIADRLQALEAGLKENRNLLDHVRAKVDQVSKSVYFDQGSVGGRSQSEQCPAIRHGKKPDVDMADVYEEVSFDNADGGVWKQGWEIKLNQTKLNSKKLQIFVVPHSHNDPGWLKTFEKYFNDQTKHILNNMIVKLPENPKMKFIWAETSYLAFWWKTLTNEADKEKVKKLLRNGQLEIVTGGWVMNDEANSHYYGMISQMTEGHEWLRRNLEGYKPKSGWAIDPFGLSPTMAFLYKRMGFDGMVIQRVHYSIKKYLAQHQALEFKWRQHHETDPYDDILCHMMPFYSYDVPHTCGPDPKVCCQFDFKRMPPYRISCPWKVPPQRITDNNVQQKAALLLEQYRKKSMLYRTNSLLVPLGDDFRYDKQQEWDYQSQNYQRLFDYMNSRSEWNVEAKFGTLSDYFASLGSQEAFPSLSGDFFTYADRDDHYWSGYYTSRPFYKRFDRILESHLRAAEIILSFGAIVERDSKETLLGLLESLDYARQNLALFQHHDGITGTAKDAVVIDYAQRMHQSIVKSQAIMSQVAGLLLGLPIVNDDASEDTDKEDHHVKFIEIYPDHKSVAQQSVIVLDATNPKWNVIAYNSLASARDEMLCFLLGFNATDWTLTNAQGRPVEVQLNYVWSSLELVPDRLEVCFMAHLQPLSITQFMLRVAEAPPPYSISTVKLYNFDNDISDRLISTLETPSELELENEDIKLVFSGADGMLRRVIQMEKGLYIKSHEVRVQFMTYGTRTGKKDAKSGAYLFLPDTSEAQGMSYVKPKIRVTRGTLCSKIEVIIMRPVRLRHQISIIRGNKFFNIENEFHLMKGTFSNKELMMRFFTDIQNEDVFYTDLNGFQMIKRKKYLKIPLQGNVYPVPTLMYIEDETARLNVLTAQPLGGTSFHPGFVDIFMDRRLLQDDSRGLGQGVTDNRPTKELFKVIYEPRPAEPLKPSQAVQNELHILLHPAYLMFTELDTPRGELALFASALPCDVHLVNLRCSETLNTFHATFIRFPVSCDRRCPENGSFALSSVLPGAALEALDTTVDQTSLSLMHVLKANIDIRDKIAVNETDFATFALKLKGGH